MNTTKRIIAILALTLPLCAKAQTWEPAPDKGFVSWLPAAKWEDALLTGNGTIGAMTMGYPFDETIIFNHALLFWPGEKPIVPPNMGADLDSVRQLFFDGKWEEAAKYPVNKWKAAGLGDKKWTDGYVSAVDLDIQTEPSNIVRYQRMTNYTTGENIVNWEDAEGIHTRSLFVSRDNNMAIMNISGEGTINSTFELKRHPFSWDMWGEMNKRFASHEFKAFSDGFMTYKAIYGEPHEGSPIGYQCIAKVVQKGGEMLTEGNAINVINADEVTVFFTIIPIEKDADIDLVRLKRQININTYDEYSNMLAKHCAIHAEMYNRCQLNLNATDEEKRMTSETLVLKARRGTTPGIMQRQFEAARYNILCSTGTNPPNLQGIWSGTWTPPWSSDFTHDGNVAVAVSNMLNGNMPELLESFFNYHEKLLPYYRENAKQLYGAKGIHIPAHTSNHGYNNHFDETWCLSYWNGGAGWTSSYFYDYYLFTGDKQFLAERAYPFMKESIAFWEDMLIKGDNGKYIVVPSYSPENNPLEHKWQNCINATMDIAIIKQLLRNCISASEVLGIDLDKQKQWKKMLSDMPAYQIADNGVLKEWMWPGFTDNQAHRHASHLYGLYEVPDPEIAASKPLQEAAKKTITERMKIRYQQNGGEMAFGMCHLAWAAENLGDTETAYNIATWLSRFYWTKGMATTHNPGELFNMDISGGFPSVLTRMLATSAIGSVSLQPALPKQWRKGSITGVAMRGQITLNSLEWANGHTTALITSAVDQKIKVDLPRTAKDITVNGKTASNKTLANMEMKAETTIEIKYRY